MSATVVVEGKNVKDEGLGGKNRRVLWVLLGVVAVLVISSFLVGVRW